MLEDGKNLFVDSGKPVCFDVYIKTAGAIYGWLLV